MTQGSAREPWWRRPLAIFTGFRGERLALRAGNLTFITITSLVPLAAVVLSLVHLFDAKGSLDSLVLRFFDDVLSPGGRSQSEAAIRKFLLAAKSRAGGGLSFGFLLISAGLLLRHLDASLNEVWQVRRTRPLHWSLLLYAGVLLLGPLFLVAGLLGSEGVRHLLSWAALSAPGPLLALGSSVVAMAAFTLLYKFAPHAPVRWKSALVGGGLAGLAWELARRLYGSIASFFFSANPLYGSLGLAPLFLMWLYVGWYVVLSGARFAYAMEHAEFHHGFRDLSLHPRSNELIGARVAGILASHHGTRGVTLKELASALSLPAQRVGDVVDLLEAAGLVIRAKDGLHCAQNPSSLTLLDVSAAVGGTGQLARTVPTGPAALNSEAALFATIDEASIEKLSQISWQSLATDGSRTEKA
jgi:membrane protein